MKMHQVEVDDEVFVLVKAHAEPLVDTFNSSLKKLLFGTRNGMRPESSVQQQGGGAVGFPAGTPEALRQILDVVELVRRRGYSRIEATKTVAKRFGVAKETVQDKYSPRQLGVTSQQFDRLLEQADLAELKQLLRAKFEAHMELIDGIA